ncbi:MAG: ABC transporter substrate-binding protein [Candidatus Eisenbacteria bacterium]
MVELGQTVEAAHAPTPTNDSEAILFRQLYETLTELDCEGNLRGRLAERWEPDADARVWMVTLAPRRFWDGSALRAQDVVASWRTSALRVGVGRSPFCWVRPDRMRAIDDRRIEVALPAPMRDFPRVLAHPALAVASPRPGATWPVGSGTFMIAQATTGQLSCPPNPYASPAGMSERAPRLTIRMKTGSDPRDLAGQEPVVRRVWSRKAVSFLATRGLQVERLPWSRRYVLLLPDPVALTLDRSDIATVVADAEAEPTAMLGWKDAPCVELALPSDTDAGSAPEQSTGFETDSSASDGSSPVATERRLEVWSLANDPDAMRIAERVAARASASLAKAVVSNPVESIPFYSTLRAGRALAFVVAIPEELETTCEAPGELTTDAPWLLDGWDQWRRLAHPAGASGGSPAELERYLIESARVVPILRTGASLVSRPGLVGVRIDGSGLPRFGRAGWSGGSPLP